MQYNLSATQYIRQYDEYNWAVCSIKKPLKGKYKGQDREFIEGYSGSITGAKKLAVRVFGNVAESHKELNKLIDKILKIK